MHVFIQFRLPLIETGRESLISDQSRGPSLSGQFHKFGDVLKEKSATDFTEWHGEISFLLAGQQKRYLGAAL